MCDGVCFWRKGGGLCVWELTLLLNDLIERHPSTLLLPQQGDGSGGGAARDPPLPPQQFAVWEGQRGGQRSNKCSEMEVLSHVNASQTALHHSRAVGEHAAALHGGIYEYDARYNE